MSTRKDSSKILTVKPALVRALLSDDLTRDSEANAELNELLHASRNMPSTQAGSLLYATLKVHIRAMAKKMRHRAKFEEECGERVFANTLYDYANQLEGEE
jgi:hypothetical protein